ncbi:MAG: hypothetical protein ABI693_30180 [Bryobacteraceae bacterium]
MMMIREFAAREPSGAPPGPLGSDQWFPGRWVGGTALIVAPLLLLAGVLLRLQFPFFFPHQLSAYSQHPTILTAAYSCFLAGNILLWPAILTVVHLIMKTRPLWAIWGGSLTLLGLFARTFHAGIDHLAFQLVRLHGVPFATTTVASSYGAFHVVASLNAAIFFGWIVLAIGAWRSGTLGLLPSIGLGSMAALMMGVLKGTSPTSVIATTGLCIALLPLGTKVLWTSPRPRLRQFAVWVAFLAILSAVLFFSGQLG